MKLYEITEQFKQLESLDGIDEETMLDTLESLEGDFLDKGQNVAAYFQNLDADVNALKEAETKIAARRKAIENKSKSLKDYLLHNMKALNITKIECPEFSVSLRKASEIVEVYDESLVPKVYTATKIITSPNKKLIKGQLKAGVNIDGARLSTGKQSLIIK